MTFVVWQIVAAAFHYGETYRTMPGVIESSVSAFATGLTFTLFTAVFSPRPWPVGVVAFAIQLVIRVVPVAYLLGTAEYMRPRAAVLVPVIAASAAGGLLALYLIGYVQREAGHAIKGGSR